MALILVISIIFFDIYSFLSPATARYAALTQFVPSALSFISSPSVIFSSFLLITLVTLASGRSYCSFLCPLGIFQDVIARISPVLRIRKKYRYARGHNFMRYAVLLTAVVSYPAAGTLLVVWLDPFSIYGRFASGILSPAVTVINNNAVCLLSKFNIYSMHSADIKYAGTGVLFIVIVAMISISALALFKGRLYCNTVCPAGTLLGLVSEISFFKIEINKDRCVHCGKCEMICKSSCISHDAGHVDFSRCVSCFNCLKICPNSSIKFRFSCHGKDKTGEKITDREHPGEHGANAKIARRSFLAGMLFLPSAISAVETVKKQKLYIQDRSKQKDYKKKIFTSPPGSMSIENFNARCTACSLCITRCPSSVLQPAVMQYGLHGIMQPYLDFNTGYCNYDCTICGDTCPTGAIHRTSVAEKHLIQTGKSLFIKENCITYTNGTDCGACSEHCPTKAVNMIPFKNNLVIPQVNQAVCTGCGACEHVCPVRPVKAIYVEGNSIHRKAELPKKEKTIKTGKEDFPF